MVMVTPVGCRVGRCDIDERKAGGGMREGYERWQGGI